MFSSSLRLAHPIIHYAGGRLQLGEAEFKELQEKGRGMKEGSLLRGCFFVCFLFFCLTLILYLSGFSLCPLFEYIFCYFVNKHSSFSTSKASCPASSKCPTTSSALTSGEREREPGMLHLYVMRYNHWAENTLSSNSFVITVAIIIVVKAQTENVSL